MTELDYLLTKLMEECAEVIQQAAKCQRFGLANHVPGKPRYTNADKLHGELDDVMGVLQLLNKHCELGYRPDEQRMQDHADKTEYYYERYRTKL